MTDRTLTCEICSTTKPISEFFIVDKCNSCLQTELDEKRASDERSIRSIDELKKIINS